MPSNNGSVLDVFFPATTSQYFEVISWSQDENNVCITLEEKDQPPQTQVGKKVLSKGFHDITITDFPIRGKRALLTFRRRYWQVEGQKELLKRDIQLAFPGTQLEKEFADFLKADGGRSSGLAGFYRRVSAPPSQRI